MRTETEIVDLAEDLHPRVTRRGGFRTLLAWGVILLLFVTGVTQLFEAKPEDLGE
jgi:hypothetical protein